MIKIEEYLSYINEGEIPPYPPNGASPEGFNYMFDEWMSHSEARSHCCHRGLWTVIDQLWTKNLADWIGDRQCLEVMAGGGWLSKALDQHGIKITATDKMDKAWMKRHKDMNPVFPVDILDGLSAVKEYPDAEILIVCWPPYGEMDIVEIVERWGSERPIVYIGESSGGCNAPDEFFQNFVEVDEQPQIPLMSWFGIHDYVTIGFYKDGE